MDGHGAEWDNTQEQLLIVQNGVSGISLMATLGRTRVAALVTPQLSPDYCVMTCNFSFFGLEMFHHDALLAACSRRWSPLSPRLAVRHRATLISNAGRRMTGLDEAARGH
jgi:hypothetical protein